MRPLLALICLGLGVAGIAHVLSSDRSENPDGAPIDPRIRRGETRGDALNQTPGSTPTGTLGGHPGSQYWIKRDFFLPAADVKTVSAQDADYVRELDEVFGVVVGGQARAYPIPFIAYHHVVNDRIGDVPITVTY